MSPSSFLCLLNVILSALLPLPSFPAPNLAALSLEQCRHLAILGRGRVLFINFSLIEVPRAMADPFSLLCLPALGPSPHSQAALGGELFSTDKGEGRVSQGTQFGEGLDLCFLGQWLCGGTG